MPFAFAETEGTGSDKKFRVVESGLETATFPTSTHFNKQSREID